MLYKLPAFVFQVSYPHSRFPFVSVFVLCCVSSPRQCLYSNLFADTLSARSHSVSRSSFAHVHPQSRVSSSKDCTAGKETAPSVVAFPYTVPHRWAVAFGLLTLFQAPLPGDGHGLGLPGIGIGVQDLYYGVLFGSATNEEREKKQNWVEEKVELLLQSQQRLLFQARHSGVEIAHSEWRSGSWVSCID